MEESLASILSVMMRYFTLFSISKMELLGISNIKFSELLSTKIRIETDLATNLGYNTNWSYSTQY